MNTKSIFLRIIKSDLTYAFIFFSFYLWFFLNQKAGIFFAVGFLLSYLFVKLKNIYQKYPIILLFYYLIPFIGGYYFFGTYQTVGFLTGTAIAGFMMANFSVIKNGIPFAKKISNLEQISKVIIINQVGFSFYYFYLLIIKDIRGQNKLEMNNTLISVLVFIIAAFFIQWFIKKLLYKKLDTISYSNVLFVFATAITFGCFYNAFLEIGALNVILPAILSIVSILSLISYIKVFKNKQFKLQKSVTTLFLIGIPIIMLLYYPWGISKYISLLFTSLSLTVYLSILDVHNLKDIKLNYRIFYTVSFIISLILIMNGLFTMSTRGIITKLDIANVNYLLMLLIGIALVMFLQDIRKSIKSLLKTYNLVGTYSVITIAVISFILFYIVESSGIESLVTLLFGLLAVIFIKNVFTARTVEIKDQTKDLITYTYLENTLLNLMVIISLSLMLVRV